MKELLDVVDEKGCPTGEVVDREYAHLNGIRHRTAHLWLLRKHGESTQILLQKRCKTKDSFPGCYDISSAGHIPAGVDYKTSAIRELKEELGIEAEEKDLIFCADREVIWDTSFNGKPFHDRQISRVFVMWLDLPEEKFIVQTEEVERYSLPILRRAAGFHQWQHLPEKLLIGKFVLQGYIIEFIKTFRHNHAQLGH